MPKSISQAALDAPLPPLPPMNGHGTLQVPALNRMSTFSMGSAAAYVLPALRLGPTPSPSPSPCPSGIIVSPSGSRIAPSVPVTAVSSPRQSLTSARGSRPSTSTNSPSVGAGGLGGGLLPRALSAVGSISGSGRSRDSISVISEGTVGELPSQTNGDGREKEDGLGRNGTIRQRGLKRLSSLMKR